MATIATVVVAATLIGLHVPASARLLIWPLAAAAAVTWLQLVRQFCVAFGAVGLENFGRLGDAISVEASTRAADRRRALELVVEGALIGLAVALVLAVLPI